MDRIKIIFFDVDGTLIDMNTHRITPVTRQMLKTLQEKGILVCLATGRGPVTIPDMGVTFDACVTYNGSLCFTAAGETVFSNPHDPENVQKLIRNAAALGRPVSIATRDCLAANGYDQDLADYYTIAHQTLTVTANFEEIARGEVYQLMLGCRPGDFDAILSGVEGAAIAASWDRAADVIPSGGGKGRGVSYILEYLGIEKEESMAFGDGDNDLELFAAVGMGIAMGNASPRLKAVAHDICGSITEDGIFHYLIRQGIL